MSEELHLVRLNLVRGMTPRASAALLSRFGSAEEALRADPRSLGSVPEVGPELGKRLLRPPAESDAEKEIRRARRIGVEVRVRGAKGYPEELERIPDPPLVLYVRGELRVDENAFAVVGARRAGVYGRVHAERFAKVLARAGLTVVSGLARGIDAAAHRGALDAGGRTIAVLGSGLDRLYPAEHRSLAGEIRGAGAVITELPLSTPPRPYHFPRRNRIIAGLSRGVLVVEGKLPSGSLITAHLALEGNKLVFALPGRVDTELSAAPHSLIRDGAILVENPEQILLDLGELPLSAPEPPPLPQDPLQRRILETLTPADPLGVDELLRGLGAGAPELLAALSALELSERVRPLPGRRYIRVD
jgi:DNA processing protein